MEKKLPFTSGFYVWNFDIYMDNVQVVCFLLPISPKIRKYGVSSHSTLWRGVGGPNFFLKYLSLESFN